MSRIWGVLWFVLFAGMLAASALAAPVVGSPIWTIGPAGQVEWLTQVIRGPAPGARAGGAKSTASDPDLEPGFPVQARHEAGSFGGGPALHTLVGNFDGDPQLEIVATGLAQGPLYAWNHDGTPLTGWPVTGTGAGYPVMGRFRRGSRSVFAGFFGLPGMMAAYTAAGKFVHWWPLDSANYVASPATAADVRGTALDEIFTEEQDGALHGYMANSLFLRGWPVREEKGGQHRYTPAVADLDGDGDLEIITSTEWTSPGSYIFAYHHNGSTVAGFPVRFDSQSNTYVAVGDVDGDAQLEIVLVARPGGSNHVMIYSRTGVLERSIPISGAIDRGSAPALADLNGDHIPEIIVQGETSLHAFYGNGSSVPGWPVTWESDRWMGYSAPVVGDIDGDGAPEVVVTSTPSSSEVGEVRAYKANGMPHPKFPKVLPIGFGAVPAIADIDLDGRNELVVCGAFWNGEPGYYDKCWAFDLKGSAYGGIEWGQYAGNSSHLGRYPVPPE